MVKPKLIWSLTLLSQSSCFQFRLLAPSHQVLLHISVSCSFYLSCVMTHYWSKQCCSGCPELWENALPAPLLTAVWDLRVCLETQQYPLAVLSGFPPPPSTATLHSEYHINPQSTGKEKKIIGSLTYFNMMSICENKRGNNNCKQPKFKDMSAQNKVPLQKIIFRSNIKSVMSESDL